MSAPLHYTWDGEAMHPLPRFAKQADRLFVVGETYPLEVHEERSIASHRQYFATIREAWLNLNDDLALEFTSADRLRKRALIATGWFTERRMVASSAAEARKFANFIMQRADDGTLISIAGHVVVERTARSQRTGAGGMKKAEFQKSKTDVLEWIAALIRVELQTLAENSTTTAPDAKQGIPYNIMMAG